MVWEGEPISLQVPAANLVSQRDAIDYTLLSMERSANPPWVVNIAGPALRVADLAERLGRTMGRSPRLASAEGDAAVLADDRLCRETFGEPRDPVAELEQPIARWVTAGGLSWDRPDPLRQHRPRLLNPVRLRPARPGTGCRGRRRR